MSIYAEPEKKYGFEESKFAFNLRCTCCNGSGIAKCEVSIHELIDLVSPYYSENLKIDATKAVRAYFTQGELGLKSAKLLVENCFNFLANLEATIEDNKKQRS